MVKMLASFRGLYGHCSWHWGIASPLFITTPGLLRGNSFL
jgi:hypothetical protein